MATGTLLILGHLSNLGGPPGAGTVTAKNLIVASHAVMVLALVGIQLLAP